jgi:hypothetical protein
MVSTISNTTQPQPVAQSPGASTQKPTQSKPKSAASADSAQLSTAALAALASLKEATENPAQTATEAGNGDLQAQRLLATETAAKPVAK